MHTREHVKHLCDHVTCYVTRARDVCKTRVECAAGAAEARRRRGQVEACRLRHVQVPRWRAPGQREGRQTADYAPGEQRIALVTPKTQLVPRRLGRAPRTLDGGAGGFSSACVWVAGKRLQGGSERQVQLARARRDRRPDRALATMSTAICHLYCAILYCTVLYYTILYYTILYSSSGEGPHAERHPGLHGVLGSARWCALVCAGVGGDAWRAGADLCTRQLRVWLSGTTHLEQDCLMRLLQTEQSLVLMIMMIVVQSRAVHDA